MHQQKLFNTLVTTECEAEGLVFLTAAPAGHDFGSLKIRLTDAGKRQYKDFSTRLEGGGHGSNPLSCMLKTMIFAQTT